MVMPPPDMWGFRRKTPVEIRTIEKQIMASKIMGCLKAFQPKRKRKCREPQVG